jgi:hypothetical protein
VLNADGSSHIYNVTVCDDGSFWASTDDVAAFGRFTSLADARGFCNGIEDYRTAKNRQAESDRAVNAVAVAGDELDPGQTASVMGEDDLGSMMAGDADRWDGLS